jgi:hypothetical protein
MAIAFINNNDQLDKNNNCNNQNYLVRAVVKADQASTPPGFPQSENGPKNLDFDVT